MISGLSRYFIYYILHTNCHQSALNKGQIHTRGCDSLRMRSDMHTFSCANWLSCWFSLIVTQRRCMLRLCSLGWKIRGRWQISNLIIGYAVFYGYTQSKCCAWIYDTTRSNQWTVQRCLVCAGPMKIEDFDSTTSPPHKLDDRPYSNVCLGMIQASCYRDLGWQ